MVYPSPGELSLEYEKYRLIMVSGLSEICKEGTAEIMKFLCEGKKLLSGLE